jgi:hypothetical protein
LDRGAAILSAIDSATTNKKSLVGRIGYTTRSIKPTTDWSPTTSTNNSSINDQLVCYSKITRVHRFNKDRWKSVYNWYGQREQPRWRG